MKAHGSILTGALSATVAMLLLTAAAETAEPKLPKPNDRWIEVRTANFILFSNANERMTRAAGSNLEQLRLVLGSLFGDMKLTSPVPTYIFVFDHPKTFAPYSLTYEGKTKELGGYFNPGPLANNVAIVGSQYSRDVSSIIYHEYIHYVLNTNQAELPLWLNEGLAELYSTFDVEDGLASIGYPVENHLRWLRNNQLIPMAELVAMDHDSPSYNEGHRRGVFYAQSWALTHMLVMGSSESPSRATVYANLLRQGVDDEDAFRRAMGGTYKEIEKELNHYVRGRRFSYSKLPVTELASTSSTVEEMVYPDVLTRLGGLLTALGSDRFDFAAAHFSAALRIDEDFGPAIAGLGRLDEAAGRDQAALARYRRAAELAPEDFMINYLLGDALFRQYESAESTEEKTALADQARAALRRAAVLRPSFAEAWAKLGYTYTRDPEPDDMGVKAMEHAHRLLPKRGDVGFNLTLLHLRRDRLEDAMEVVARMRSAGVDEGMVLAAEELTISHKNRRAEALARASRVAAGGSDIENAAAGEVQSWPGSAERQRFTARYNEAVALINAGKTDEAITMLEVLEKEAPSESHAASARGLLDQTRAYVTFTARAQEAQELANSGEIDAAIAILEPLLEQAPDEAQADPVRRFLAKLYAYRDFQEHYNQAVDLINAGSLDSAIEILEPLVAAAPTPQLTTMAKRLLDDLKRNR